MAGNISFVFTVPPDRMGELRDCMRKLLERKRAERQIVRDRDLAAAAAEAHSNSLKGREIAESAKSDAPPRFLSRETAAENADEGSDTYWSDALLRKPNVSETQTALQSVSTIIGKKIEEENKEKTLAVISSATETKIEASVDLNAIMAQAHDDYSTHNIIEENVLKDAKKLGPPTFVTAENLKYPVQALCVSAKLSNFKGFDEASYVICASKGMLSLYNAMNDQFIPLHEQNVPCRILDADFACESSRLVTASTRFSDGRSSCVVFSLNQDSVFTNRGVITKEQFVSHVRSFRKISASSSSTLIMSSGAQGSKLVVVNMIKPDNPIRVWKNNTRATFLEVSDTDKMTWCGGWDGTIKCWDVNANQSGDVPALVLSNTVGHTRPVTGLSCIDHHLVSAGSDGFVMAWDSRNPSLPISSVMPDTSSVLTIGLRNSQCAFSTLNGRLYLADADLTNITRYADLQNPKGEPTPAISLCWEMAKKRIIAGTFSGQVCCWELE